VSIALVGGALANKPRNGGEAWVRLSWMLGLQRLGHAVHLVEEIDPSVCVDAAGAPARVEDSVNLDHFRSTLRRFGLHGTLLCDGATASGLPRTELLDLAASADLLLNISGHVRDAEVLRGPRRRIFLDIDPGFTQAWHAAGQDVGLRGHDVFATIAERIGTPGCSIPTCGVEWVHTRQPVVLDEWSATDAAPLRGFTTVATWRCPFGPVEVGGAVHSLKHQEMRRLADVPLRSGRDFEVALSIDPADGADRERLRNGGWSIVDPLDVVASADSFRDYVASSAGEFSAAQGVYAATRSGWLSDRTARYLASGRPAIVQDTATTLPTGAGLLTFADRDGAVAAVAEVMRDYASHAAAARQIAETHLDSDLVVGALLERAGIGG
jgi:hypothetical protein